VGANAKDSRLAASTSNQRRYRRRRRCAPGPQSHHDTL